MNSTVAIMADDNVDHTNQTDGSALDNANEDAILLLDEPAQLKDETEAEALQKQWESSFLGNYKERYIHSVIKQSHTVSSLGGAFWKQAAWIPQS